MACKQEVGHCDLILRPNFETDFFHFGISETQGPTNAPYKILEKIPCGSGEKVHFNGLAIF